MPWITDEQAAQIRASSEALEKISVQLSGLLDAVLDTLTILESQAEADIKLMRIEDILTTAVDALKPE
jgi:hypothetical protein